MKLFVIATILSSGWNATGNTVAGITGSPGISAGQLTSPFGVALGSGNTLYIADRGNHRIQKWIIGAANGTTICGQSNGISGVALNYLNNPANLVVDASENIYLAEVFNHRVLYWPSGASMGILVAGNSKIF